MYSKYIQVDHILFVFVSYTGILYPVIGGTGMNKRHHYVNTKVLRGDWSGLYWTAATRLQLDSVLLKILLNIALRPMLFSVFVNAVRKFKYKRRRMSHQCFFKGITKFCLYFVTKHIGNMPTSVEVNIKKYFCKLTLFSR